MEQTTTNIGKQRDHIEKHRTDKEIIKHIEHPRHNIQKHRQSIERHRQTREKAWTKIDKY